ncbi:DsbA family protein, partial [Cupriavidus basilensis]
LARLGSPKAMAARQAQVREAAREAGLELALERIEVLPNTLLAHRLIQYAAQAHGAPAAAALIDGLFTRYFVEAQDIGDPAVLRDAILACGIVPPGPSHAPVQGSEPWLPWLSVPPPPLRAGQGVPQFVFAGRHCITGARTAPVLFGAMQQALATTPRVAVSTGA